MQFKFFTGHVCMWSVGYLISNVAMLCAGASDELQQKVLTLTTFNNQLVKQLNDKVKFIVKF